ncbi:MAG: AmmeMemoRadiSam system protein B [Anaerolineae bacterium]|nr:AmmeMemoRadiSam system protein B [Anaerolineae bacterium]
MNAPHLYQDVRPSPIAGRWYSADPLRLARSVDEYLEQADVPALNGDVIGVLTPHAGHRYSGPVAGHAFKLVQGLATEVVALVGPSHYPYDAPIVTTAHEAYETPLGQVPVDRAALAVLGEVIPIKAVRTDPEHSLEIELPFLQRALGEFRMIPLALVEQSYEMAQALGQALADTLAGTRALLVASSDLSHFYPQDIARRLDGTVLDAVARYDPADVIQAEVSGSGFACGRGAIATIMIAARALGADTAQIVGYATSGDVTRDYAQVVGYGAAVFYRRAASPGAEPPSR